MWSDTSSFFFIFLVDVIVVVFYCHSFLCSYLLLFILLLCMLVFFIATHLCLFCCCCFCVYLITVYMSYFILQLRMADDMQYAFSYLYFLMSEKKQMDIEEVFAEIDTDQSGLVKLV